jgi:large subunit ribosomal protein L14
MVQKESILNIIDNSGAKSGKCIKVNKGYKCKYGLMGDIIILSIKSLRSKRRLLSKIKKGSVCKGLIIRAKKNKTDFSGSNLSFNENSIVLLTKKNKLLGTRIFGKLPKLLRFSRYLKLISLSSGVIY